MTNAKNNWNTYISYTVQKNDELLDALLLEKSTSCGYRIAGEAT